MSEKMLVTQALDERDLLVKKIGDKIQKLQVVDTKKRNEEKTVMARVTVEEYGKGDTLEFVKIRRSDETLLAGILKDARNEIKAIIPARYERYRHGILDTVDYAGRTEHDEGENPEYEFMEGHVDIDFEAFAHEFLTSEKEMMITHVAIE